jgi:biopolymer transport protein ExbB
VAPLLGLLGTVVGMINTFQTITLVGSTDPKLMAGGISQALVTTVLGLTVTVPLLFSHSFVSSRVRMLMVLLSQQSLGIIAQAMESRQEETSRTNHD